MWHIDVHKQQGMGKWGWLFAIVVLISVGASALRVGPHYVDFEMVKGVLDRLPTSSVHEDMTRAKIREHFDRQFRIENFGLKAADLLEIERNREETIITVAYEVREPLVYNADVVLSFTEQRTYK